MCVYLQAGRELTRLSGFTARVYDLLEKVTEMTEKGAEPFEVREDGSSEGAVSGVSAGSSAEQKAERRAVDAALVQRLQQWSVRCEERARLFAKPDPLTCTPAGNVGGGEIVVDDGPDAGIEFDHADLVSPDGKLLVKDLSFKVERGVNVMVTGD